MQSEFYLLCVNTVKHSPSALKIEALNDSQLLDNHPRCKHYTLEETENVPQLYSQMSH